jgi:hypothetical protein
MGVFWVSLLVGKGLCNWPQATRYWRDLACQWQREAHDVATMAKIEDNCIKEPVIDPHGWS